MDIAESRAWPWGTTDTAPRVLHAMIRVNDLDRSLRFYVDLLGMKVIERYDASDHVTLYIGFENLRSAAIELECYPGRTTPLTHGSGFGHISLGFPDVVGLVARLEAAGVKIVMAPLQYFPNGPHIALAQDPDGYVLEFVQTLKPS